MAYFFKKSMLLRHFLTAPVIWAVLLPLVFLDFITEIYHQIGFRLCRIPLVKRSAYIKIDRHKLKYLNFLQKLGCVYCGYANGLLAYIVEIAARTEKYWCAIKHKPEPGFIEPRHHKNFAEYGNEDEFKKIFRN